MVPNVVASVAVSSTSRSISDAVPATLPPFRRVMPAGLNHPIDASSASAAVPAYAVPASRALDSLSWNPPARACAAVRVEQSTVSRASAEPIENRHLTMGSPPFGGRIDSQILHPCYPSRPGGLRCP
jgi:hypothetical protein